MTPEVGPLKSSALRKCEEEEAMEEEEDERSRKQKIQFRGM
jgi:hypothetical protein